MFDSRRCETEVRRSRSRKLRLIKGLQTPHRPDCTSPLQPPGATAGVGKPVPGFVPASFGSRRVLRCADLTVVAGLVFVRRDVARSAVQASLVVPVDPAGGGPFDVVDGGERAGVER